MKNYTLISMWLLGKTKVSDKELNDVFRNLGISHILVISGTHLTILFNVVGYLLLFIVANYWLNIGILALFLITFLFLTGMSSSILRATLF
jgi:competence protein ComEC